MTIQAKSYQQIHVAISSVTIEANEIPWSKLPRTRPLILRLPLTFWFFFPLIETLCFGFQLHDFHEFGQKS